MDVPRVTGAAQRRKQRRIRSWWRHEQVSVAAAFATALHHSSQRGGGVVRRPMGTEDSGNREEEVHDMYRPPPGRRPEPLEEVSEPQAGIGRHTGVCYELVLNPVVPQMAEQLVEVSLPALAARCVPSFLAGGGAYCSRARSASCGYASCGDCCTRASSGSKPRLC